MRDRGSMLLASMLTVSFGVLIFLGIVTSTLSERVSTQQIIQQAQALQLAHSGVEYALWEINYNSGANYAGWTPTGNPNEFRYTKPSVPIDVTVKDDGTTEILITSRGQAAGSGVRRTIKVRVPPKAAAAGPRDIFDQLLYAKESSIHLWATGGGAIELNGYDSSLGSYGAGNNSGSVEILSDWRPMRLIDWDQPLHAGDPFAAPIVLEGNVTTNAKVVYRTCAAAECTDANYQPDVGFANKITAPGSFTGTFGADSTRSPLYSSLPFSPKAGDTFDSAQLYWAVTPTPDASNAGYLTGPNPDPNYSIDPTAGEIMVVCPGEILQVTGLEVKDIKMVIGCTNAGGEYDCSNPSGKFHDIWGVPFTAYTPPKVCTYTAPSDPSAKVKISIDPTRHQDVANAGDSAFKVTGAGGKVVVNVPIDIYYTRESQSTASGTKKGFDIGGGGIENRVLKGSDPDNKDPKAFTLYGGSAGTGTGYSSTISTSQAFYGAIFDPSTNLTFENSGPLDFFGSVNVRKISTDKSVKLHWDAALKTSNNNNNNNNNLGTCTPASHNCLPISGSWSVENN